MLSKDKKENKMRFALIAICTTVYAVIYLPPFAGGMICGMILLASVIYHALEGKK